MRKVSAACLTTLLALSAAACSLPGSGGSDQPPAAQPPSAAASTAATGSDSPSAASATPSAQPPAPDSSASAQPTPADSVQPTPADSAQPSAGDQLGPVVARRSSATDGHKIAMTLYAVQRDGATSHVNFTLSSPETGVQGQVGQLLTDGNASASDELGDSADGLQLVDGKNAKLYLVASDGRGQCLCSRNLSKVFLRYNVPVLFSATFAAPPAGVTSVDVRIPNLGTVKNVPVQ